MYKIYFRKDNTINWHKSCECIRQIFSQVTDLQPTVFCFVFCFLLNEQRTLCSLCNSVYGMCKINFNIYSTVMKRMFKQWLSKIRLISTKRIIATNLNSLNTKRGDKRYYIGNIGPGLGQAQQYGGVQPVNEIPTLPLGNNIVIYRTHSIYFVILLHTRVRKVQYFLGPITKYMYQVGQ